MSSDDHIYKVLLNLPLIVLGEDNVMTIIKNINDLDKESSFCVGQYIFNFLMID